MIIFVDVLELYKLPDKIVMVLYTYITKSDTFCSCVKDVQASRHNSVVYIHYKVKYHKLMWWGCASSGKTLLCYIHKLQSQIPFTRVLGLGNLQYKAACVIHVMSHNQSIYIAIYFSVMARII